MIRSVVLINKRRIVLEALLRILIIVVVILHLVQILGILNLVPRMNRVLQYVLWRFLLFVFIDGLMVPRRIVDRLELLLEAYVIWWQVLLYRVGLRFVLFLAGTLP